MDHFQRRDKVLHCEDVPLEAIAAEYGTPTYVYSQATISRHVRVLQEALEGLPHIICYAVKANANLAILDLLQQLGCGFDAVSVGELARVSHIGASSAKTIVSGVGKRDDEIAAALDADVLYICAESREELEAIGRIAAEKNMRARVSIRVNPDVDAKTHPYIATGMNKNKFGVPIDRATDLYQYGLTVPSLELVGVTCHIGSQVTQLSPFTDAAERMVTLTQNLRALGAPLRFVGMGGGLGIPYGGETPPSPADYGRALKERLGPLGLTVILEPGRVIVGNAGILLSRVVRTKQGAERNFVLVDAGMNDLIRPALYQAHHTLETVAEPSSDSTVVDVVGPVCESADTFAEQLEFAKLSPGDLIAIRSAGAYGFVMACNYNGRPRPAEILCHGATKQLIRARETLEHLWHGETRLESTLED